MYIRILRGISNSIAFHSLLRRGIWSYKSIRYIKVKGKNCISPFYCGNICSSLTHDLFDWLAGDIVLKCTLLRHQLPILIDNMNQVSPRIQK